MCKRSRWFVILTLVVLAGCAARQTRLDLITYSGGQEEHHYAEFGRASYRTSPDGLLELVMKAERPSSIDPTQMITQIMYLKTFWTPRPGRTYAESTQINGSAQYALLTPPTGVRYDGAAFVSYKFEKQTGELIAQIESGTLTPRYQMGDAVEPFGPARFSGTVRAVENPREVVNTQHVLETMFSRPIPTK